MIQTSAKTIFQGIKIAALRFPIPTILTAAFCIVSLMIAHNDFTAPETSVKILQILFDGVFGFIAITLFAEMRGGMRLQHYAVGIALLVLLSVYVFFEKNFIAYTTLAPGIFLSMFIAPFVGRQATGQEVWNFAYTVCIHILFTILASLVLFLGISALLAALNYLFAVNIPSEMYRDCFIVIASLFAPLYAMSGVPTDCNDENHYPRIFRLIVCNLVLPLILIYCALLYAYGIKILINWDLPSNEIARLVSCFAWVGIAAYLISFPLRQTQSQAQLFHRYFFVLLIGPLILLGISLFVRIDAYGLTTMRYSLMISFLWLVAAGCYRHFISEDGMVRFLLTSKVVLLLFFSFGPWGVFEFPAYLQANSLKQVLQEQQILVGGKIKPITNTIDKENYHKIKAGLEYLVWDHEDKIKPWFSEMPQAEINKREKYHDIRNIMADMGIQYSAAYEDTGMDVISTGFDFEDKTYPKIAIAGYDNLVDDSTYGYSSVPVFIGDGPDAPRLFTKTDHEQNIYLITLEYPDKTKDELRIPLADLAKTITFTGGTERQYPDQIILDQQIGKFDVRLIVIKLFGNHFVETNENKVSDVKMMLLFRKQAP